MKSRKKATVLLFGIVLVIGVLSPIILSIYWHLYWNADEKLQSVLPAPPACLVPPGVAVDGYASANVETWEDVNGDGARNTDEPALRHVVVMIVGEGFVYNPEDPPISEEQLESLQYDLAEYLQVTDRAGKASVHLFRPGCACNCWIGQSIAVWGPAGYRPTTPSQIALTNNDQIVSVGFRRLNP